MRRTVLIVGLLLLASLATAAEPEKRSVVAAIDADGVQRVEVIGGGYFYDPYRIQVQVNVPVELTVVKAKGMVPHNIVMRAPEAGIDFDEEMKTAPKIIRFTPTRAGTYPFYCSKKLLFLESHQEKGMEGVLEVVE
ncbi:MAG: cupredoxin domain-containing protein [Desulfuromonadales bacterium]|nr:cupredoxin domain-containing protein [Desulfuromonadales bacterium]